MRSKASDQVVDDVIRRFSLASRPRPVNLFELAAEFGVDSVEEDSISSLAMLVPTSSGYKVVLKRASTAGEEIRQRFSLAHELGHLLLRLTSHQKPAASLPVHRMDSKRNEEEKLCDRIAAEILMPSEAFSLDASEMGWSLGALPRLRSLYGASVQATASRIVSLSPEVCHMGIWKPAESHSDTHKLQHSLGRSFRYGIPNQDRLPRGRLWLIARSEKSSSVEFGCSPLVDRNRPSRIPNDVPAEAWAWGHDEYRRVLVFYYPERALTSDMLAISSTARQAF